MDDTYKEYVVPRGITYPGKAVSPVVYPGYNRALVEWNTGNDPKVVKTMIFWNNYTDSAAVDVPAGQAVVGKIIEPLEENDYTFIIRTYDEKGNVSVPSEVTGSVYGEAFRSRLINRTLTAVETGGGKITVAWGDKVTYGLWSELHYVNRTGTATVKKIAMNETNTELIDYQSDLRSLTMCLPSATAIDTVSTALETQFVLSSAPFKGPHILSSAAPCIIPARDFDFGGEGLAFHDNNAAHQSGNAAYRRNEGDTQSDPVDVVTTLEIGYTEAGEWLVYTVTVEDAGTYAVDVNLSVNSASGSQFHFEVDGVDQTGTLSVPNNGSWSAWRWIFESNPALPQPALNLTQGTHKIKFYQESAGFNIMDIRFVWKL
jgi:hypothetical protein